MSIFSELNKTFESPFTINTDEYGYKKLSEMEQGKEYTVVNCFINPKSKFGIHGVFGVMDGDNELFNVSLPKHLNDIITTILDNKDMIAEINNGNCKFRIKECNSKKYNCVFHTIDFVE